ncbi:MAG TPA: diguanylate cyclase [Patescibacteria group bacterium]|nr:diguanylate cyclase [Patescibacteria group bacterium]
MPPPSGPPSSRPPSPRSPSSRHDEIDSIKAQLQACLNEDPINLEWALDKVDRLAWSFGKGTYSSLLLLLCNLTFEEDDAHRHWDAMLKHRAQLEGSLGRVVALRVAAMDYLIGLNRQTSRPRLLELLQSHRPDDREMTDSITGLHTRRFIEEQLPREAARAHRFLIDLSFVHLEIDDFARLTEEHGTTVGTVLLQEMAAMINGSIRNIDYAARLSGAQFGLLLTETDRMGAYYVAERIRQKVEEFYLERRVGGRSFGASVSAGVASYPEDAESADELAARASEAWFTARTRGPGRVAIYYRERREYMRLALDKDDLQVTLTPEGSDQKAPVSLKNISSGGVLFESPTPIDLGRTVHILCRNKRDADNVLIPGRVVRIEKFESDAGERYEIGVLFDLVVEEQLEGVIDFLERFSAEPSDPAGSSDPTRAS